MKYVQRRANRYEFRFPLPDDLAGKPVPQPWPETLAPFVNARTGRFKTELIRSLQTTDGRAADRKALAHIAQAQAMVDHGRRILRDGPPEGITPQQIAALIRDHEIDLLLRDEALRSQGIGLDLAYDDGGPPHDGLGMTDDDLSLYRFTIGFLDRGVRAQAAKMRPSETVQQSVNQALQKTRHRSPPRRSGVARA